jgi:hypothetical protein
MAASIPTKEPTKIQQGDTVKWTKSLADYSAADGWILTYEIKGNQSVSTITATTTNTTDFLVNISAATTADWDIREGNEATYWWSAFVTATVDSVEERYNVGNGTFVLTVDMQQVTGLYDGRSQVKKTLDAINLMIEGKASSGIQTMQVEGEMLILYSSDQLLKLKDRYQQKYEKELSDAGLEKGEKPKNKVYTRFVG